MPKFKIHVTLIDTCKGKPHVKIKDSEKLEFSLPVAIHLRIVRNVM